jgi:F420H(2)-dependent quinone reductase
MPVRAREARGDERRRLWRRATAYNPLWERYQRRTERTIPLVVLEPRPD